MNYQDIIWEKGTDGIARLILNRPEKLNAVSRRMYSEIKDALTNVRGDSDTRVVIIKGAGRSFCAGHDLSEPDAEFYGTNYAIKDEEIAWERYAHLEQWLWGWFDLFWELPQATIAQVHGHAVVVGQELAMLCDLVVAADDATFRADPFMGVGGKFTNLWPLLMGIRKCKEVLLSGGSVSGRQAADLGLINRSVRPDKLAEEVEALATEVARAPLEFIAFNKLAVNKFFDAMGVRGAVEASIYTHAMASLFSKRAEFVRITHEEGWRAGADFRRKLLKGGWKSWGDK